MNRELPEENLKSKSTNFVDLNHMKIKCYCRAWWYYSAKLIETFLCKFIVICSLFFLMAYPILIFFPWSPVEIPSLWTTLVLVPLVEKKNVTEERMK